MKAVLHDRYGSPEDVLRVGEIDTRGRIGSFPRRFALLARSPFETHLRKLGDFQMPGRQELVARLAALLESGTITPIIARTFSLSETPAAMRCLMEGRELGRIVVTP